MRWLAAGALFAPLFALAVTGVREGFTQDLWRRSDVLRSAEIWSPATGQWTRTGDLPAPMAGHQSIGLGDGSALAVQITQQGLTACRWSSDSWRPVPGVRFRSRFTLLPLRDGRVLLSGLGWEAGMEVQTVELFDPAQDAWRSLPAPGHGGPMCLAQVDGGVLALTGDPLGKPRTRAFLLDLAAAAWKEAGEPPDTLACALTSLGGGRALLGFEDESGEQAAVRLAVWEAGRFRRLPATLRYELPCATAGASGGRVAYAFCAGDRALLVDPRSGRSTELEAPPRQGHAPVVAFLDGAKLLVTGGSNPTGDERRDLWDADTKRDAAVWDLESGAFTPAAPMLQARENHSAARLADGRVLVSGGSGRSGHLLIGPLGRLAGSGALLLALLAGGAFALKRSRRRIAALLWAALGAAISSGLILLWVVSQFRYPS